MLRFVMSTKANNKVKEKERENKRVEEKASNY